MGLYFIPLIQSFLVSVGMILLVGSWKGRKDFRKGMRHFHSKDVSRMGGPAVILSFLAVISWNVDLVFSQAIWGMAIGSISILIFGVWDDFQELDWRIQLGFQTILAIAVYFLGIRADHIAGGMISLASLWSGLSFVVIWLLLSINSMNWLDGTDGLSGGVALLGALAIFLLALKPEVNQPPVAIIAVALAGAILGFLLFNFHPARIMAGTSGAMFFGFILGSLAIFAGAKLATALLVMAVPIVDSLWVIGARIKAGVSIFYPDQRHLHHQLLRIGWSQKKIALFFYGITFLLAVLALETRLIGKLAAIIFSLVLIMGVKLVIGRNINLSLKTDEK